MCSLFYKALWISARKYVLANALVTLMLLVMCILRVIDPKGMTTVIIKVLLLNPFTSLSNSVHHPHFISVSSVLVCSYFLVQSSQVVSSFKFTV
jgi:hypothetical protein